MIDNLLIIGIVIAMLYLLSKTIADRIKYKKAEAKNKDEHIEWMDGEICLKKKNYPSLELNEDYKIGVRNESNNNSKAEQGEI